LYGNKLFLSGQSRFSFSKDSPIYSYGQKVYLGDNYALVTATKVFSQREATPDDGLYCGFRFMKIYDSRATLSLFFSNKLVGSINLTDPELVLRKLSDEYTFFYKPHDIDNDGKEEEFLIAKYANCNGNFIEFVKANKKSGQIEKIPVINSSEEEQPRIYADISPGSIRLNKGSIETDYYNNTDSDDYPAGFYTSHYEYGNGKLIWMREEKKE